MKMEKSSNHKHTPDLFTFGIPAHNSVHNGRLSGFRVSIIFAHCVYLDVLHVVHIDELLIDIRAISPGMM